MEGTSLLLDKNCLIHTFWLLFIGGIQSKERIIKHECLSGFFVFIPFHFRFVSLVRDGRRKCRLPSRERLEKLQVQVTVSTQLNKPISVWHRGLSLFSIPPSTVTYFCLYYSPLCSSSSLSLSVSCLPAFGARPVVIVWALTVPILSMRSFCYRVRNNSTPSLDSCLFLSLPVCHQPNDANVPLSPLWTEH